MFQGSATISKMPEHRPHRQIRDYSSKHFIISFTVCLPTRQLCNGRLNFFFFLRTECSATSPSSFKVLHILMYSYKRFLSVLSLSSRHHFLEFLRSIFCKFTDRCIDCRKPVSTSSKRIMTISKTTWKWTLHVMVRVYFTQKISPTTKH